MSCKSCPKKVFFRVLLSFFDGQIPGFMGDIWGRRQEQTAQREHQKNGKLACVLPFFFSISPLFIPPVSHMYDTDEKNVFFHILLLLSR